MGRFGSFSLRRPFPIAKSIPPASHSASPFLACFPFKWLSCMASSFAPGHQPREACYSSMSRVSVNVSQATKKPGPNLASCPPLLLAGEALRSQSSSQFQGPIKPPTFILQHFLTALFLWAMFQKSSNSTGLTLGCECESSWLRGLLANHKASFH